VAVRPRGRLLLRRPALRVRRSPVLTADPYAERTHYHGHPASAVAAGRGLTFPRTSWKYADTSTAYKGGCRAGPVPSKAHPSARQAGSASRWRSAWTRPRRAVGRASSCAPPMTAPSTTATTTGPGCAATTSCTTRQFLIVRVSRSTHAAASSPVTCLLAAAIWQTCWRRASFATSPAYDAASEATPRRRCARRPPASTRQCQRTQAEAGQTDAMSHAREGSVLEVGHW
jgi:hypothetical protein